MKLHIIPCGRALNARPCGEGGSQVKKFEQIHMVRSGCQVVTRGPASGHTDRQTDPIENKNVR